MKPRSTDIFAVVAASEEPAGIVLRT